MNWQYTPYIWPLLISPVTSKINLPVTTTSMVTVFSRKQNAFTITVTMGMSYWRSEQGESFELALKRADDMMYQNKKMKRSAYQKNNL